MTEWPSPLATAVRRAVYAAAVLGFAATVWLMCELRDLRDRLSHVKR